MTRGKELLQNTMILTIGRICTQMVNFFLLPLYTALLTPAEYGIVDLLNTYSTLLVPIFGWQLELGLFRFLLECREKKERQTQLFSTIFMTNLLQCGCYLLFYVLCQPWMHFEYKYFLALDVVINILLNTELQFARGIGKQKIYAFGSFLSSSLTVLFNVVLIAVIQLGATGMIIATLAAKIVTVILLAVLLRMWRYFALRGFQYSLFKEVCRYSLPLIPNQMSWWIVNVSDRILIKHILGVVANGIYTVANKFPFFVIGFYNVFNLAWNETVSLHIDDADRDLFLTETINRIFRLFSCICIGLIACMPIVFPIFVNDRYQAAYDQIPILILGVMAQGLLGLYSVIYAAKKMSVELAKTSCLAAVINILINVILMPSIGLYAASVSTCLAYFITAAYRYWDLKKYVSVKLDKKIMMSTVIAVVCTLVVYYCGSILFHILMLLVSIGYGIYINKSMLLQIINTVWKRRSNHGKDSPNNLS